ncbi:DNA internalization-related competence protein ComEC/Rec2 [Alteromonas pelagimontana]|uniref:DNA internalization-related competence protein ComEC/Rec2 n=1 Tax=Alteromonas pelagimontana TaxID=1858656 RepID=A0A6M4MH10_9ALTE|nr:DNA internalization-related competence protein ComEC/Rec2 [Alteromonas pelagimontana]QJR82501.1 DNA internalization-related competence protein ComEC/Rec2 [Alteromonas pelagimontana]
MQQYTTIWLAAFCAGALSAVLWPVLPNLWVLSAGALLLSALLLSNCRNSLYCVPSHPLKSSFTNAISRSVGPIIGGVGLLFGALWVASVGHWHTAWQLPLDKIQQDVVLTGQIVEYRHDALRSTMVMSVSQLDESQIQPARKIALSWAKPTAKLAVHQQVLVTARLKPAYGSANPGTRSKQQYLVAKEIVATGYIRNAAPIKVLQPAKSLHYQLGAHIDNARLKHGRWLKALLIGDRSDFTADDWQMMQVTGTAHLFSISGLHLGMVAAFSYGFMMIIGVGFSCLSGLRTPVLNLDRQLVIPVLAMCAGYAHLAGWQLPVTRALVLLSVYFAIKHFYRHWAAHHIALWMLVAVIICFPFSILSASLYLSAGAVLMIWFINWRSPALSITGYQKFKQLIRIQLWLSLLMLPVTLGWFGAVSLTAPVVNLFCVPLVSLLVPVGEIALLLSWFLPHTGMPALEFVDWLMGGILRVLSIPALEEGMVTTSAFSSSNVVLLLAAIIALSFPPFQHKRLISGILLVAACSGFVPFASSPWYFHSFDVGQGTALLISRGGKGVIVDTGKSFLSQGSYMEAVVIPALNALSITQIDHIFVSHGDDDHAGGLSAILEYTKANGQASEPAVHLADGDCQQGLNLMWEGLSFSSIWPLPGNHITDNNHSCVLLVDDGSHRLLLPGDIERSSEYALLYRASNLNADVLVAPHHGSSTSSSGIFVQRVSPKIVVFSQGYANQWGFPSSETMTRYQKVGAKMFATSYHGYIRIDFTGVNAPEVFTYRQHLNPRWFQLGRKPENWIGEDSDGRKNGKELMP